LAARIPGHFRRIRRKEKRRRRDQNLWPPLLWTIVAIVAIVSVVVAVLPALAAALAAAVQMKYLNFSNPDQQAMVLELVGHMDDCRWIQQAVLHTIRCPEHYNTSPPGLHYAY